MAVAEAGAVLNAEDGRLLQRDASRSAQHDGAQLCQSVCNMTSALLGMVNANNEYDYLGVYTSIYMGRSISEIKKP